MHTKDCMLISVYTQMSVSIGIWQGVSRMDKEEQKRSSETEEEKKDGRRKRNE